MDLICREPICRARTAARLEWTRDRLWIEAARAMPEPYGAMYLESRRESWLQHLAWMATPHMRLASAHFRRHGVLPVRVPGCVCASCLPRRRPPLRPRRKPLRVEAARAIDIADVAHRLGLGAPRRVGAELALRCPFHDDNSPSLRLNRRKQRAFCNPCGRAWDGIALTMDVRRVDFPTAVRWLTNETR